MEQMNWDDVRLFLAVAEQGSFRKAAQQLEVGHSTLSRRIESLEDSLGVLLFSRKSTGLTLTSAGEELQRTGQPIQVEFAQLQVRMFGQDDQARGNIRFTAPSLIIRDVLMQPLREFCTRWPDIHIEVDHSLDLLDLSTKEADIAIRMTNTPGDHLIGRKVGVYCEAAYAGAEYLRWFEAAAPDAHRWLYPGGNYRFEVLLHAPYQTPAPPRRYLTVPDLESQVRGAELGMGIAMLPCLMADANPKLQRISNVVKRTDIWLLAHRDTRNNRRMQLFRDFLVKAFAAEEDRMRGLDQLSAPAEELLEV